jgi:hypothetical protein
MKFSVLLSFLCAVGITSQGSKAGENARPDEGALTHAHSSEIDLLTGEGANIGGFLFPEIYLNTTGGVLGGSFSAADLATAEHDPQNDFGIQGIEVHLDIDVGGVLTGAVYGAGFQGEDEWEAALEEAYLHYHLSKRIAVGGGQFLNRFGFQSERHLHSWDFVNQNLINSRMLNEGELITQGGEAVFSLPMSTVTIGGGGVRTHGHAHEEEEEGDHGHEGEGEEEHHLEPDGANFNDWVLSFDWRQRLPFDESMTLSTSVATGENGFGRQSWAYGVGLEKIWGAHDHGDGAEFCSGALMLRSEFIGRHIGVAEEDGERFDASDNGISSAISYGLGDATTLSLRHDWVSALRELELEDRHRISPALTTYLDKGRRVQARLQYDYNHSESIGDEHAAWLQFQVQWGGGGHSHHEH